MLTKIITNLCICVPLLLSAQVESNSIRFVGEEHFLLEGTLIPDSLKEHRYDRLPIAYKEKVRPKVWELSKASAGLSIRFQTNSPTIHAKWSVLNDATMNHMAETGIKGVDLYVKLEGNWQYLNTARPTGRESEAVLISNMPAKMREYKLYLPLYDGVVDLEVGIDENSTIQKPSPSNKKPIIFYGTSITQGGCASRPGMVHTNILSRKLDRDCINFGFSGNGKMEQPIAELISMMDPIFYVVECIPNMKVGEISERTAPLVQVIRKRHPETPIVLVENFDYTPAAIDTLMRTIIQEKNRALKREYERMLSQKIPSVFYIESTHATGSDHEGTVDGIHFTDLGFIRYAEFLLNKFHDLGLIEE